jgi:hypothetical protein
MVTHERWLKAQEAERSFHNESFEEGRIHYGNSYAQYFNYLGIDSDLKGLNIVEIGPADFPALGYCQNIGHGSFIIEPMPSDHLKRFNIPIQSVMAEDAEYSADEVWLFNVLQHVVDPYKIAERAKRQANVIRFFEPINYGVNECHPWNLTLEMFKEWFGECVQYYPFNDNAKQFHTWECAYGVWRK